MKIYISGKIGSDTINDAIRAKFAEAQEYLESLGHNVTNPVSDEEQSLFRSFNKTLENIYSDKAPYARHLFYDIASLMYCDAIFMLSDYMDSPGAKAELAYAQAVGMEVIFQTDVF